MLAISCQDDEVAKKYQVTLTAQADGSDISSLSDFQIQLTNAAGEVISLTQDENSKYVYSGKVIAGTYNAQASASNDEFNFFGSKVISVSDQDVAETLILTPSPKQKSGIIFKEVYFTGCHDFYFYDAFYELVNNSDEVQYLDGIILSIIDRGYGSSASAWADSTGVIPSDFYPLTNYVMQFPGSGKEHAVQPGEVVVVACQGMDHTQRELTESDSPSPANLADADWELHIPTSQKSVDHENVANLNHIYGTGGFVFMPAVAGAPLALIKLPEGLSTEDFLADSTNYHSAPGKSAVSLTVPCDYVIDAIDIQNHGEEQIVKCFNPAQDAGWTFVSGGDETSPEYNEFTFETWTSPFYCGKSLRRKCTMVTAEGRAYFKDTNNSSNDFIIGGQRAVVRRTFTTPDE